MDVTEISNRMSRIERIIRIDIRHTTQRINMVWLYGKDE